MSVRTVSVRLQAEVQGFIGGTRRAGAAVNDLSRQMQGNSRKAAELRQAWTGVGRGATLAGLGVVAAVGYMVKVNTEFEKQLSAVQAVSNATAADMDKYRRAALDAGRDTAFSAKEAAQAETELAKVGLATSDILGGALKGSLDLAAAGQLDLANAATLSGQAMKIFGLGGKDVGHIADVLSSGANKSAADVGQLGQALQQGGLVAAQTGLHLEDTVGVLSAFADNALMGSDAGTSLKTMLQRLTPQSAEAQAEMDKLGLAAYDSSGQFVGLSNYAQQLQDKMGGLTTEQRNASMQIIFGADAVRASNILYKLGAAGVDEYTRAVDDTGAASRTAAIQMDNLAGDLEQLRGSLETAFIQSGSAANGGLRGLTQGLTDVVNGYSALPLPVQQAAFDITALTGVTLLAGGVFISTVPKIAATKTALDTMGISAARAKAAMSTLGPAALIVGTAFAGVELSGFIAEARLSKVGADDLTASLLGVADGAKTAGAFGDLMSSKGGVFGLRSTDVNTTSKALEVFAQRADNAFGQGKTEKFNRFADFGGQAVKEFESNVTQLDTALAGLVSSGNTDAAEKTYNDLLGAIQRANAEGANIPIDDIKGKFTQYQAALDGAQVASTDAAGAADAFAGTVQDVGEKAADAAKKVDDLVQSLIDGGMVHLSARDAARAYLDSLDAVDASIKENGRSLDVHSAKGRKNQAVLDDVAKAVLNQAHAVYEETKATKGEVAGGEAMRSSLVKSRGSLVATAQKFGLSKKAAGEYADKVLNIPAAKSTKFTTPGLTGAVSAVEALRQKLLQIRDKHVTVSTTITTANKLGSQPGLDPTKNASGGYISGPGTGTSDSIPALLSNGEYVIKASQTKKHRGLLTAINSGTHGYADGGYVQRFADGGQATFTSADFSGIIGRIPTSTPTRGDIADLRAKETRATRALANAEDALDRVRHRKGHTAADVARAERAVANARDSARAATRKLGAAEDARASASKPFSSRFHTAATADTKQTRAFLRDIAKLRSWGFNNLADQLLTAGDEDAMRLAHDAAGSAKTARTLNRDVRDSAAQAGRLSSQQAAVQGRLDAKAAAAQSTADFRSFLGSGGAAARANTAFLADVQAIAGRGFGDLAQQLLALGPEEGADFAKRARKMTDKDLKAANSGFKASAAQAAAADQLPARLAIQAALAGGGNPTLAQIAATTGISTSDLQAAALSMRATLGGNPGASRLLAGLASTSTYTATGAGSASGDAITVQVTSTGNPWRDGERALAGARRVRAVSRGRW